MNLAQFWWSFVNLREPGSAVHLIAVDLRVGDRDLQSITARQYEDVRNILHTFYPQSPELARNLTAYLEDLFVRLWDYGEGWASEQAPAVAAVVLEAAERARGCVLLYAYGDKPERTDYLIGEAVRIHGLVARADLNETVGTVVAPRNEAGRVSVDIGAPPNVRVLVRSLEPVDVAHSVACAAVKPPAGQ